MWKRVFAEAGTSRCSVSRDRGGDDRPGAHRRLAQRHRDHGVQERLPAVLLAHRSPELGDLREAFDRQQRDREALRRRSADGRRAPAGSTPRRSRPDRARRARRSRAPPRPAARARRASARSRSATRDRAPRADQVVAVDAARRRRLEHVVRRRPSRSRSLLRSLRFSRRSAR